MKLSVLAALLGYTQAGFGFFACPDNSMGGMASFDKTKMEGLWYGFGGFDDAFWTNEVCPNETYTPTANGFSIKKEFKEWWNFFSDQFFIVDGTMVLDAQDNGKGQVQFPTDDEMKSYNVAFTDYTSYAIVYSCNPMLFDMAHWTNLYVLTRSKTLDAKKWQEIQAKVQELGVTQPIVRWKDDACGMTIEGDNAGAFLSALRSPPSYDDSKQEASMKAVLDNLWKGSGANEQIPSGFLPDEELFYGGRIVLNGFSDMVKQADWQDFYQIRNWQEDENQDPATATKFWDIDILTVGATSNARTRLKAASEQTDQTEKCCWDFFSAPSEHPSWISISDDLTGFVRVVNKEDGQVTAVFEGQMTKGVIDGFGRITHGHVDLVTFAGWFPSEGSIGLLAGQFNDLYTTSMNVVTAPAGTFKQATAGPTSIVGFGVDLSSRDSYKTPLKDYRIRDLRTNDPSEQLEAL